MSRLAHLALANSLALWLLACGGDPPGAGPSAGVTDDDAAARDGADGPPDEAPHKHSSCERVAPSAYPAEPLIARDTAGQPVYNRWTQFSCAGLAPLTTCSEEVPCALDEQCLRVDGDHPGVCDSWVSSDTTVAATFRAGLCATALEAEAKAAACCDPNGGFDCRVFPLLPEDARSRPGELCEKHADCEPGLVCDATSEELPGAARCVCPGVEAERIVEPVDCVADTSEKPWGGEALRFVNGCAEALSAGWVIEIVSDDLAEELSAVEGADGALHLLAGGHGWLRGGEVTHLVMRSGVLVTREVLPGVERGPVSLAIDRSGGLHAAVNSPLHYASNVSGSWVVERLSGNVEAASLALDGEDRPAIAWGITEFELLGAPRDVIETHFARRVQGVWQDQLLDATHGVLQMSLMFGPDDAARLAYTALDFDTIEHSVRTATGDDAGFEVTTHALGHHVDASASRAGAQLIGFGLEPEYDWEQNLWSTRGGARFLRLSEGASELTPVWDLGDERYEADYSVTSIAADRDDRAWIAHTAPEGLVLRGEPDDWTAIVLAPDVQTEPELIFDRAGEPHLFYGLSERDFENGERVVFKQLRHVHRGSCAP